MKNIILLFFLSVTSGVFAQSKTNLPNRAVFEIDIAPDLYQQQKKVSQNDNFYFETKIPIPVSKDGPFIAFSVSWEVQSANGRIEEMLYQEAKTMKALLLNHHIEKPEDRLNSELTYILSDSENLVLEIITTGKPILKMKVHFFNPGFTTNEKNKSQESTLQELAACPCPQPTVMTRSEWCPTGDCPENPSPTETFATHLIIHHSAGVNTSSDWSSVVRSVWNYHVNTLGWSDIGYNWLIDPNGKLYRGRGKDVQGAHFCGTNSNTAGICLLGTYTSETPPFSTIETLKQTLAWYTCIDDIDPLGVSNHSSSGLELNHISGHRDGCATECPGEAFYPSIENLRTEVADYVDQVCGGAGLPDVFVESLNFSSDPIYTNESITLSTTIRNQGALIAENINVTLSLDGNLLAGNVISNLEPGESAMFSNTYNFQETGMTEFCVAIDPVANEIEIGNNISCLQADVESIVGIKDFSSSTIYLFPNPNKGHFFLKNQIKKEGQMTIFNSLGQLMLSTEVLGQELEEVNLSGYPKGVYFTKVETGKDVYFGKVIVE